MTPAEGVGWQDPATPAAAMKRAKSYTESELLKHIRVINFPLPKNRKVERSSLSFLASDDLLLLRSFGILLDPDPAQPVCSHYATMSTFSGSSGHVIHLVLFLLFHAPSLSSI